MNRAFHIGIGMAVAVHMVFGCCSHLAHGSHSGNPPAVENSGGCGGHGHDGGSHGHQSGDQGCDGDQCVSIRPESDSDSEVTAGADGLPLVCVAPAVAGMNGIHASDMVSYHCGPAIPLHLLNQALLL